MRQSRVAEPLSRVWATSVGERVEYSRPVLGGRGENSALAREFLTRPGAEAPSIHTCNSLEFICI
jgi:hypothetical protein